MICYLQGVSITVEVTNGPTGFNQLIDSFKLDYNVSAGSPTELLALKGFRGINPSRLVLCVFLADSVN